MEETTVQVKKIPNPNGKGGFGDNPQNINAGGRIRNPLKEFQREEFAKMTDDEKRNYLKEVDKYRRWTMAEGNPEDTTDITSNGEGLAPILVQFINAKDNSNTTGVQKTI